MKYVLAGLLLLILAIQVLSLVGENVLYTDIHKPAAPVRYEYKPIKAPSPLKL